MIIKWDAISNIPYSSLTFVSPNAEGRFNVGDILTFENKCYGSRIGLVINAKKDRKGIPVNEKPQVSDRQYILANSKLAHGFWVRVQWFLILSQYPNVAKKIPAYNCTHDSYVADSCEVVLSNRADWTGVIDIKDVSFVFHSELIKNGMAYSYGMKNAYSIRYMWDVKRRKVNKIDRDQFFSFSDDRFDDCLVESTPKKYYNLLQSIRDICRKGLCRVSMTQGTTYQTNLRVSHSEWNWFKRNINVNPLMFKGTRTYSFLRRGLTYESVRTKTCRECIRIDSMSKLKESKKAIGGTFAYGVRKRAPKAPRHSLCPIGKVPSKRSVAARKRCRMQQETNSFTHLEPNSIVNAVIIDDRDDVVNSKVRTTNHGVDFIYDPSSMYM